MDPYFAKETENQRAFFLLKDQLEMKLKYKKEDQKAEKFNYRWRARKLTIGKEQKQDTKGTFILIIRKIN